MSKTTNIQWCDSTLNFWEGCTKVSAGCAHCYAEARDKRFTGGKLWGKGAPRRKSKSAFKQAFALNRKPWVCDDCGHAQQDYKDGRRFFCEKCNGHTETVESQLIPGHKRVEQVTKLHRRRIFSLSLGDWLDPEVPIEWLAEMLDTIRQCDQVTWILCTKRPEQFYLRLEAAYSHPQTLPPLMDFIGGWLGRHVGPLAKGVPKNIILLVSVENQKAADERIPILLALPAAARGLSMEPLLERVDLSSHLLRASELCDVLRGHPKYGKRLNWVIIGGESGQNARPCNIDWIRVTGNQCRIYDVPVFVKQLGANCVGGDDMAIGQLKDKKGGNPVEWPFDLRVQEWPQLPQ